MGYQDTRCNPVAADARRPEVVRAIDDYEAEVTTLLSKVSDLSNRLDEAGVLSDAKPDVVECCEANPSRQRLWSRVDQLTERLRSARRRITELLDRLEV